MDYDPKNLQSVLLYMRQKFGAGIFDEPPRMFSILLDLAPGLKRDGNVLRQMSDAGLLRELRKVSESGNDYERVRAIGKSRGWLGEDYLTLASERVEYFMTVLQVLYGLEVEPPKAEPSKLPKIEPTKSTKAQAPPKQPIIKLKPPQPNGNIIDSGYTGDCIWVLDKNYVLTISGQGQMDDTYYFYPPWYDYRGIQSVVSVVIEYGVTSIGNCAFCMLNKLLNVTIPDSITSIGGRAFHYCQSLTSLTIPDSVTSIGWEAFSDCFGLTSMTIPDGVTSIEYGTLSNCISLTNVTIPDSVTSIGAYAFCNCESLTSVTIPDSVTSIGECAFRGCTALKSMTIPDGVTSIGGYTFEDCQSLTSVTIPDSVTVIKWYAFSHCFDLTSVTIPDSVTSIEVYAFHRCYSLKQVSVSKKAKIDPRAFDPHTQIIRR